jgi:hypothetical protein
VNVVDARIRKVRWTHLLSFAGRRPAKQHCRNPDSPEPQRFGYQEFEMIHRHYPSFVDSARLLTPVVGFLWRVHPASNAHA